MGMALPPPELRPLFLAQALAFYGMPVILTTPDLPPNSTLLRRCHPMRPSASPKFDLSATGYVAEPNGCNAMTVPHMAPSWYEA